MVGTSGCAEEPDIRDELRFFGTVSAWESEFVIRDLFSSFFIKYPLNVSIVPQAVLFLSPTFDFLLVDPYTYNKVLFFLVAIR